MKPKQEPLIVRDFDKLVCEPVSFKLHGKAHTLNPITVQEFWRFSESMIQIQALANQKEVTIEQLAKGYLAVFQSVCPSITLQDVEKMSQAQVGALLQFIVDTIKGASQTDTYQKKTPEEALNPST